jgi:hypothetical protein
LGGGAAVGCGCVVAVGAGWPAVGWGFAVGLGGGGSVAAMAGGSVGAAGTGVGGGAEVATDIGVGCLLVAADSGGVAVAFTFSRVAVLTTAVGPPLSNDTTPAPSDSTSCIIIPIQKHAIASKPNVTKGMITSRVLGIVFLYLRVSRCLRKIGPAPVKGLP